jgi:hypothetical protein
MSPTDARCAVKDIMEEIRLGDLNMDELLGLMTTVRHGSGPPGVVPLKLVHAGGTESP